MAEKYFNRDEAEGLLPFIGHCLKEACEKKKKVEVLNTELSQAATRIMVLGGSVPHFSELVKKKSERNQLAARLAEAISKIQESGCVVKDLDQGLVDFPSLLNGEEVYLCWKLGERRIGYWHGIHECSAGRKPLDDSAPDEPPRDRQRLQ